MTRTHDPKPTARHELIVADLHAGFRDREIAERHGVTRRHVNALRHRYGVHQPLQAPSSPNLPRRPHPRGWRDDELVYLKTNPDQPITTLAAHLGRTVGAVRFKRWQLMQAGQLPKRPSRWDAAGTGSGTPLSATEQALLDDQTLTVEEVAQRTGRTPRAIAALRWKRGLASRTLRPWTDDEIATLQAMKDRPIAEIAAVLDRSRRAIIHRRARLGSEPVDEVGS